MDETANLSNFQHKLVKAGALGEVVWLRYSNGGNARKRRNLYEISEEVVPREVPGIRASFHIDFHSAVQCDSARLGQHRHFGRGIADGGRQQGGRACLEAGFGHGGIAGASCRVHTRPYSEQRELCPVRLGTGTPWLCGNHAGYAEPR